MTTTESNTREKSFPPIQKRLMQFIQRQFQPGYNHYNVSQLIGDASTRQYYRYVTDSGGCYILAAYPKQFTPERFTYKQIYDLFCEIQLPVPEIVEIDGNLGIVLQEDLGNVSLQKKLLKADQQEKARLLRQAIDHIIVIQEKGSSAFRQESEGYALAFDREKLLDELNFFRRFYLRAYRGLEVEPIRFESEFKHLANRLASYPRVLCHRDYHVRNLMLKKGKVYIIDFQDARWGPASYDLVSLLKDSIELEAEEVSDLVDYYRRRAIQADIQTLQNWNGTLQEFRQTLEEETFQEQFQLMCIQRLLKALGTYGYQITQREHFIYEQYISGSLHRALLSLEEVKAYPAIEAIIKSELEEGPGR